MDAIKNAIGFLLLYLPVTAVIAIVIAAVLMIKWKIKKSVLKIIIVAAVSVAVIYFFAPFTRLLSFGAAVLVLSKPCPPNTFAVVFAVASNAPPSSSATLETILPNKKLPTRFRICVLGLPSIAR